MQGERRANREELIAAYGLSRRLAARVAALLSRKMDVTPTLLEMARPGSALEALLLGGGLVDKAESISEEQVRTIAGGCGFAEHAVLRLVAGEDGWRTLALEDDVLAEEVQAGETTSDVAEAAGALVRTTPAELSSRETGTLFTPEQVAELKLEALTSQDVQKRTEALRKLVFTPIPGSRKAEVFVHVLLDSEAEPRVRREAMRSLEQLGFRPDLAEAVRGLFAESGADLPYFIQRLGALAGDAGEAEQRVTLAVLLEALGRTEESAVVAELLRVAGGWAELLVGDHRQMEQFLQAALRHLERDFDRLRSHVDEAILRCAEAESEWVGQLLWKELDRRGAANVRSFLITVLDRTVTGSEAARELTARALSELVDPRLTEKEKARLRYGLVRLAEPAVKEAVSRLQDAKPSDRPELVRVVDVLCREGNVSPQMFEEAVRALLDMLRVGDRYTRRTILEVPVLGDARIEEGLQAELAEEMLSHMAEFRLPDTLNTMRSTLERIGPAALRPLFEYIQRQYPEPEVEAALLGVGRIIRSKSERVPADLAVHLARYCFDLFDQRDVRRGGFTVALASVCGFTEPGRQVLARAVNIMRERLWKVPYSFDMLDALGIIAGSPNVARKQQEELCNLFDNIVSMKGPEKLGYESGEAGERVYIFGREVDFDAKVVPAVVRGLGRICVSENATPAIRRRVIKRFLILWEGVSTVRIAWSPAAIEALVRGMCDAACSPPVEPDVKVRLGRSLLRFLNKLSVVRSIGQIGARPEAGDPMEGFCLEAAHALMAAWERSDEQDDERRAALLKSIAQIAANPSLDNRNREVAALRDNALRMLFRGLRESVGDVREPLEMMYECPALSRKQRNDIAHRLTRAYGIVKV